MTRRILKPSEKLIALVHHRWAIPVLSQLALGTTGVPGSLGGGARFATLQSRLDVAPASLKRTLTALIHQGLVRHNPGYGHPLRPEYILMPRAQQLSGACAELMDLATNLDVVETALRKWSLPVTLAVENEPARFSEIRDELPGVTPRALALALKELERSGLLERRIVEAYPPAPIYELLDRGQAIRSRVLEIERALAA